MELPLFMEQEIIRKLIRFLFQRSVIVFLVVGLSATLLYFSSFSVFWKGLHLNYMLSLFLAYALTIGFHFYANCHYAFKARSLKALHQQLIKYAIIGLINYGVTVLIVHTVVKLWLLSPYVGMLASLMITPIISYSSYRLWVFVPHSNKNH